jgi:hypothetical protein
MEETVLCMVFFWLLWALIHQTFDGSGSKGRNHR